MAEGETVEKPVAALVKYLNERKVHSRDKGKVSGYLFYLSDLDLCCYMTAIFVLMKRLGRVAAPQGKSGGKSLDKNARRQKGKKDVSCYCWK